MKKLLFVAVLGLIALTSCSKEKTCSCTTSTAGISSTPVDNVIKDGECADLNTSATSYGIAVTYTCVEK